MLAPAELKRKRAASGDDGGGKRHKPDTTAAAQGVIAKHRPAQAALALCLVPFRCQHLLHLPDTPLPDGFVKQVLSTT